uniref:PH domain-containing protein n=1 Tax=Timema genevievae TaxID=629358 RepID=A0A7R9K3E5_TIMGE|nr:unnamed protein product [Timema genevievae]
MGDKTSQVDSKISSDIMTRICNDRQSIIGQCYGGVGKIVTLKPAHINIEPLPSTLSSEEDEDDDDDSFLPGTTEESHASPTSMRLYLPKPRSTVQRRATVTGASPTGKRPPVNIEQFWEELRTERHLGDGVDGRKEKLYLLRDKSASFGNDLSESSFPRPKTCLGIDKTSTRLKSLKKQKLLRVNNNEDRKIKNGACTSEDQTQDKENKINMNNGQIAEEEIDIDVEQTQRITEILETINTALVQHRLKEQAHIEQRGSHKHQENPISSTDVATAVSHHLHTVEVINNLDSEKNKIVLDIIEHEKQNTHILTSPFVCQELNDSFSNFEVSPVFINKLIATDLENSNNLISTGGFEKHNMNLISVHLTNSIEHSQKSLNILPPVKICITPPEPPPRSIPLLEPIKSNSTVTLAGMGQKSKSLYRNKGGKSSSAASLPSPRSLRERTTLLAKKRNIAVSDLSNVDCEGWLLHRCRSSGTGAVWLKVWFILIGSTFYGFKTPHSPKADIMIGLSGFTASLAEEVKSRKFAFKIYHTGTVFYFAAETDEELTMWLDCIVLATLKQDFNKPSVGMDSDCTGVFFSETDDDSDSEKEIEMETRFSSPKMRKLTAGFLGSVNPHHQDKFTSKSIQNLSEDMKRHYSQKKLGSLKKIAGKSDNGVTTSSQEISVEAASSLDRKYLRFLGGSRNNIVPVPTPQFRIIEKPLPLSRNLKVADRLDRQIHASNPSLQFPSDMIDYRLAAERLREFGISRNRQREDTSGFVTLEEFMLSRQEEERRQQKCYLHSRSVSNSSSSSGSSTVPSVSSSSSTFTPCDNHHAVIEKYEEDKWFDANNKQMARQGSLNSISIENQNQKLREGTPEKLWINSLCQNEDIKRKPTGFKKNSSTSKLNSNNPSNCGLKNAAQYKPPPVSQGVGSGSKIHPKEPTKMKMAFEMHLGDTTVEKEVSSSKSSKFRDLFFSSKSPKPSLEQPIFPPTHKTLLGSPRLHRALFRDKRTQGSKGNSTDSASPVSPPSYCSQKMNATHTDSNMTAFKPTMGISMIGKKPIRRVVPPHPVPSPCLNSPPPPDYPGLEYPPVFEPETYTLSDASTLLRSRPSHSNSAAKLHALALLTTLGREALALLTALGRDALDLLTALGREALALLTALGREALALLTAFGRDALDLLTALGRDALDLLMALGRMLHAVIMLMKLHVVLACIPNEILRQEEPLLHNSTSKDKIYEEENSSLRKMEFPAKHQIENKEKSTPPVGGYSQEQTPQSRLLVNMVKFLLSKTCSADGRSLCLRISSVTSGYSLYHL